MKLYKRNYPYPVLESYKRDYKNSLFKSELLNSNKDGFLINLFFRISINNEEMLNLVLKGKAKIIFHVECSKTGYREVSEGKLGDNLLSLHEKEINGNVEICTFIVANEDIEDFESEDFEDLYRGLKFNLPKFSILGQSGPATFSYETDFDYLKQNGSIFRIVRVAGDNSKRIKVDLNNNYIRIQLDEQLYIRYIELNSNQLFTRTLVAEILFPSLYYVLNEIYTRTPEQREEDFGELAWYKTVKSTLKNRFGILLLPDKKKSKDFNPFEVAQKMLDNPVYSSFKEFKKILESY